MKLTRAKNVKRKSLRNTRYYHAFKSLRNPKGETLKGDGSTQGQPTGLESKGRPVRGWNAFVEVASKWIKLFLCHVGFGSSVFCAQKEKNQL